MTKVQYMHTAPAVMPFFSTLPPIDGVKIPEGPAVLDLNNRWYEGGTCVKFYNMLANKSFVDSVMNPLLVKEDVHNMGAGKWRFCDKVKADHLLRRMAYRFNSVKEADDAAKLLIEKLDKGEWYSDVVRRTTTYVNMVEYVRVIVRA